MKEKEMIKSEELESINLEMFGPFNPEDEPWIGGSDVSKTITYTATFSSGQTDYVLSFDLDFDLLQEGNLT